MDQERSRLIRSVYFPALFVAVLWLVEIVEQSYGLSFSKLGILPLHFEGLLGIVTSTFIHSDYNHLLANSIPILVLGSFTFYFYREVAYKVFFLIILVTNIWVWIMARENYHIGASGLVYGLATYHIFSGMIRRNLRLMALSMLIVFLYGGMLWGMFPEFFPHKNISWESHLMGSLAGVLFAWFFRRVGPQREQYEWEDEEDEEDELSEDEILDKWLQENGKAKKINIKYYRKKDDSSS